MKLFFVLGFFVLSSIPCFAQDDFSAIDPKVNKKILDLKNSKASIIVCYYEPCYGAIISVGPDSCTVYSVKYLMWRVNNTCFMQRFDNCKSHEPVQSDQSLLSFIQINYTKIRREKLKNLAYKMVVNGRDSIQEIYGIDHSCHYIFDVYWGTDESTIDVNDYVLEKTDYEGHQNINFAINQKSILNKLKNIAGKQIRIYNKSH